MLSMRTQSAAGQRHRCRRVPEGAAGEISGSSRGKKKGCVKKARCLALHALLKNSCLPQKRISPGCCVLQQGVHWHVRKACPWSHITCRGVMMVESSLNLRGLLGPLDVATPERGVQREPRADELR